MQRRTVHKINPSRTDSFDQQFWPVMVALTVLSGIGAGAILTILRGPWMWGSLLVLPVLAIASIFLLFNLDDRRLRRSLQFAVIASLALHLMVLVFASVVNIFENPFKPVEKRVVAQRQIQSIEISDQRAKFVWEETNAQPTPEPEIEVEREEKPTTTTTPPQPQPIPVKEKKPNVSPQLVRRENTAKSVPRQNPELSQLRRQTRNLQPTSSTKVSGPKTVENKTAPAAAAAKKQPEVSKQADSVARQADSPKQNTSKPEQASPAPNASSKPEVAKASSSPRRARPTETTSTSTPNPSAATARTSRSSPRIPIATSKAPVTEKVSKSTTTQPNASEPAKSSSQLTRRPIESPTTRSTFSSRPETQLSPQPQLAKSVQPITRPQTTPSISNPTSTAVTPRRSTTEAAVVASPMAMENPSRAPESKTASRELSSKTLSVTRSTAGVSGVGRAKNLDRFTGGANSPAARASDSARRERATSSASDATMLTSSQKSESRRSIAAARVPTSVLKSETSSAAKWAGAKTASESTLESSAAVVDSASSANRDEISAERGESTLDMGATKVVADENFQRRSGGGQPDVGLLNPDSTRRSKERSSQQPSLVASTLGDVGAPRAQSTSTPSTNALEVSSESSLSARQGGESAMTVERWSAESAGEMTDLGDSNLAQQLSDSRQRANRIENVSSWEDEEDDEDEENKRGTERTRSARAPVTQSDPAFGLADTEQTSDSETKQPGDGPAESVATNISREATSASSGSGIGRSETTSPSQASTSMPTTGAKPNRRNGRGNSQTADSDAVTGLATKSRPRGSRSSKPGLAPSISGTADFESPTMASQGTADNSDLESASTTLSKSDTEAMEQAQGSELDIDAIEGPAGLGSRPADRIGVMTRPSARDSEQLMPEMKNRFRNKNFGGTPALNPNAVLAKEAFQGRSPATVASAAEPSTEAAIHLGLEFLARYQLPDGSWSLKGFDRNAPQRLSQLNSDTAATGLALLSFQGAGYNHREFKYAQQIDRALQWLIDNQADDGMLYISSDPKSDQACQLYSHGIAALALTEAYGMTQDSQLKEPAQKAIDFIVNSQHARKGGWRYYSEPIKSRSTDTSVTGWMMMAMQSGRLAGLKIPKETFTGVEGWLDEAADPENSSLYRYNHWLQDANGVSRIQGREASVSMTSVGLLMRIYSGWDSDDPRLLAGADYLLNKQLPSDTTPLLRDTYYWYYATQVLKHIDGPRWKQWNDKLRPLLTKSQVQTGEMAGSWHPYKPVPDRWGQFGGRLYVTTMNLLNLEVRHRMLPLYKQNKAQE